MIHSAWLSFPMFQMENFCSPKICGEILLCFKFPSVLLIRRQDNSYIFIEHLMSWKEMYYLHCTSFVLMCRLCSTFTRLHSSTLVNVLKIQFLSISKAFIDVYCWFSESWTCFGCDTNFRTCCQAKDFL